MYVYTIFSDNTRNENCLEWLIHSRTFYPHVSESVHAWPEQGPVLKAPKLVPGWIISVPRGKD